MKKLNLLHSIVQLSWISLALVILILVSPMLFSGNEKLTEDSENGEEKTLVDYHGRNDSLYLTIQSGKKLFKRNCASCHNINMVDHLTGPALAGVTERWEAFPEEDLFSWIRNSQLMIAQAHPRAVRLWNTWEQSKMNSFPNLSNQEIRHLLAYIER